MKFAHELSNMYKRHFDEDQYVSLFVYSILEQMNREDLLDVMNQCSKEELEQLLGSLLLNKLNTNPSLAEPKGRMMTLEQIG
ncbi:hypothetical protein N781_07410 [Pontibacillus halophilus JSM 076056 = DSM 19796]|uniref:Uncharacterized protein n=1 Tax=Pontibacillus halophilus JSM 076056 = DSM 19796 TaxID=1385510 RepID=A0A0A5G8S1_9BACI|nr:DUF6154 family protein [Pontibacillus halophilus]KGX89531.1 hypothetical protein N781_07410 [Pontibacillus halophilus JSM 076056 = DSM 19796]